MTRRTAGRPACGVALLALAALACAGAGERVRPPATPEVVAAGNGAGRRPAHVVLVAIPGLAPAHYLPPPGVPALAPQLAALAEAGVAVESLRPVFPRGGDRVFDLAS